MVRQGASQAIQKFTPASSGVALRLHVIGAVFQYAQPHGFSRLQNRAVCNVFSKWRTERNCSGLRPSPSSALSTLLWVLRPSDYFPIKISYYRELAQELGHELPHGYPTPEGFDAVMKFGKAFLDGTHRRLKSRTTGWTSRFLFGLCAQRIDQPKSSIGQADICTEKELGRRKISLLSCHSIRSDGRRTILLHS